MASDIINIIFYFCLSAGYKDSFVVMREAENVRAQIVRPNIECVDGYIHLIDTVMIDDR